MTITFGRADGSELFSHRSRTWQLVRCILAVLSEEDRSDGVIMNGDELSVEQLLYIVGETDKKLFQAGVDIKRRQLKVLFEVMESLGYIKYAFAGAGAPAIVGRINDAFSSLYNKRDLAIGGHVGAFMYRDVFVRISVPLIFGQVNINPFDFVDLTPVQKRIIQTEPEQIGIFVDQFCDVFDIQYGIDEMTNEFINKELAVRFIGLAKLHMHAAAAVVTGGYDFRGAVQSSLLATDLALKAAAAAQGLTEPEIKEKYGHKLKELCQFVKAGWTNFDAERAIRAIEIQPTYVANRYSADQPKRVSVGHTLMGAQFIVAEVVRQMSRRDFRSYANIPVVRTYP